MAGAHKPHAVGDLNRGAAPGVREASAREREVEGAGRLHQDMERDVVRRHEARELAENALDLLACIRSGFGQTVVQLDDCERLDEERLPGARGVVHDSRHLRTSRGTNREHRPAAALGEKRLLECVPNVARARDACQLVADPRSAVPQLGAQLAQKRRCGVADIRAVLLDPPVDLVRQAAEPRVDGLDAARRAQAPAERASPPGRRGPKRRSRVARRGEAARLDSTARPQPERRGCLRAPVRRSPPARRRRRPSARAGARPWPGRPTGRARAQASRRDRSRRRRRDDQRSPAARAQRAPQRP